MKMKWKVYILTWVVLVFWISHSSFDFSGFGPFGNITQLFKTYWIQIDLFLLTIILFDFMRGNRDWGNGDNYGRTYVWPRDMPVEETREPSEEAVELPDVEPNELKLMQCPKCGASLEFEEGEELTKCGHCGSQVARHIHRED